MISILWQKIFDHPILHHLRHFIPHKEVDVRAAYGDLIDLDEHLVLDRVGNGQVSALVPLLGLLLDHGLHCGGQGHLGCLDTVSLQTTHGVSKNLNTFVAD